MTMIQIFQVIFFVILVPYLNDTSEKKTESTYVRIRDTGQPLNYQMFRPIIFIFPRFPIDLRDASRSADYTNYRCLENHGLQHSFAPRLLLKKNLIRRFLSNPSFFLSENIVNAFRPLLIHFSNDGQIFRSQYASVVMGLIRATLRKKYMGYSKWYIYGQLSFVVVLFSSFVTLFLFYP